MGRLLPTLAQACVWDSSREQDTVVVVDVPVCDYMMSVKVRRTPLFGVDGHLNIPVVGHNNNTNNISQVGR